jgi:2-polyprenyl-6-methoxyphenol hydroxylase-like FAD-dependent oxidoreductase
VRAAVGRWRRGKLRLQLRAGGEGYAPGTIEAALVVAGARLVGAAALGARSAPRRRRPSDLLAFKANFRSTAIEPDLLPVLRSPAATAAWSSPTAGSRRSPAASARTGSARPASASRRARRRRVRGDPAPRSAGVAAGLAGRRARRARGSRRARSVPACGWAGRRVFRIGNAAGEAHPIVGEGISMAIQSAFVLAARARTRSGRARRARSAAARRRLPLRDYERRWRQRFARRLAVAGVSRISR